jgi:hypothetical protein
MLLLSQEKKHTKEKKCNWALVDNGNSVLLPNQEGFMGQNGKSICW